MAAKKHVKWSTALLNLVFVIPAALNIFRHALACVEHDANLAKKSLVTLILLGLLSLAIIVGAWLSLSTMMLFCLLNHGFSVVVSLTILFSIHLLFLILLSLIMLRVKDNMSFPNTRDLFH